MNSEDMAKYDITCDRLDYGCCDAKKALLSILDEARQKVGFEANGDHVLVEVFPSKDGGCEMYVTRSQEEGKCGLPMPLHMGMKECPSIFYFSNAERMLSACRHLQNNKDIITSAAFSEFESRGFYLLLYTVECDVFGKDPMLLSVAHEYGKLIKNDYEIAYLTEHCECICSENAIQRLGALS